MTVELDKLDRLFVKIGLEFGLLYGRLSFAEEEYTKHLKAFLFENDPAKREQIGIKGSVNDNEINKQCNFIFNPYDIENYLQNFHFIAILLDDSNSPVACYITLFGQFSALIHLCLDAEKKIPKVKPIIWRIDFRTHEVQRFSAELDSFK